MKFYLDIFSPETYEAFKRSSRNISGFSSKQMKSAKRVEPGDILVCYLMKLSRWFGLLEVVDGPFTDKKPIFFQKNDPYIVRFHVRTLVLLEVTNAIPIHEPEMWDNLSFTKGHSHNSTAWAGKVRTTLNPLDLPDGRFLENSLRNQLSARKVYEFDQRKYQLLVSSKSSPLTDR